MDEHLKLIVKYEKMLYRARYEDWAEHGIFSANWWILLIILIIPWFFWYKLLDKKRLREMLLYIFATSFIAVLLDEIGSSLALWVYHIHIVPFLPRLITVNYTMVPLIFSLVYQYFPKWKAFIAANIVLTLVFSFILEPLLVRLKIYVLISWKHMYSVPVYFIAAVFLKWFIGRINSLQARY